MPYMGQIYIQDVENPPFLYTLCNSQQATPIRRAYRAPGGMGGNKGLIP